MLSAIDLLEKPLSPWPQLLISREIAHGLRRLGAPKSKAALRAAFSLLPNSGVVVGGRHAHPGNETERDRNGSGRAVDGAHSDRLETSVRGAGAVDNR